MIRLALLLTLLLLPMMVSSAMADEGLDAARRAQARCAKVDRLLRASVMAIAEAPEGQARARAKVWRDRVWRVWVLSERLRSAANYTLAERLAGAVSQAAQARRPGASPQLIEAVAQLQYSVERVASEMARTAALQPFELDAAAATLRALARLGTAPSGASQGPARAIVRWLEQVMAVERAYLWWLEVRGGRVPDAVETGSNRFGG